MTQTNNPAVPPMNMATLCKPMLIGGVIAFSLISIFLLTFFISVDEPNPAWPELWWVRPIAVVTLAGQAGGVFYYFMNILMGRKGGWRKAVAIILSVLVYIIGLWMGFVLGLVGTMWH